MRAVWLKEFGGPGVLVAGEAPDPVLGPGEALIMVDYVNMTFAETQIRAGTLFVPELPVIPGNWVGGVVVGGPWDGRRVITSLRGSGGYAEYVAADIAGLVEVADGVDLDTAVAVLAEGRTAVLLLRTMNPRQGGKRVLFEAAAGGVGGALVQLARHAGAEVVAVSGGARKVALAKELGAHESIDYSSPEWPELVGEVDVVFDGVGAASGGRPSSWCARAAGSSATGSRAAAGRTPPTPRRGA